MIFMIAWAVLCVVAIAMIKWYQIGTWLLKTRLTSVRWRYGRNNELVIELEDEQEKLISEMNDLCDKLARRIQAEAYDRV
jgi:hypothetical protein